MRRKLPPRDPIGAYKRKATAERRVGVDAQCACGERRPEALIPRSNPMICVECKRTRRGQTTVDNHHVAGKANSPTTIPVPANDHLAKLTVAQYDWPKKTLENPDGSPQLAAAACIRGYIDSATYLNERLLAWIPDLLEKQDASIAEKVGSRVRGKRQTERIKPKR
jgi:hypothetical protein